MTTLPDGAPPTLFIPFKGAPGTPFLWLVTERPFQGSRHQPCPKGPNLEKIQDLETFKRDWNFQASHPQNPYFSWWILKVEIENFNRDWKFQARLKIQARLKFFNLWALRVRAKGTLISEPQFSTPCEMRLSPRDTGNHLAIQGITSRYREKGHCWGKPSTKAISAFSRGKNRISLKGPKIEKKSISLEICNAAWNFQSRLNFSISTFRIPHNNRGLVGGSLENFNLAWKFQDLDFFHLWALRVRRG